jgi:diguanylate cyclase (GGDEF)-like protein
MARATPSADRLLAIIELQNAIAAASMNADEVMQLVAERARTLASAATGIVALVEADGLTPRAVAPAGTQIGKLVSPCVAERQPVRIDDVTKSSVDAETRARVGSGALACAPILFGESVVGVVEVTAPSPFTDEDVETLRLLAQIVAITRHRAYIYPRPRTDSQHDALTGIGNRRSFEDRLVAELVRNKRYGHSFSLAMLSLGGLDAANDRVGQAAGDEALRHAVNVLQDHTRVIDDCFRISAGELAIVMPGTSLEGARTLVERCRTRIKEANLCNGLVTAAFGVVEAREESSDDLVARAFAALAADKQALR